MKPAFSSSYRTHPVHIFSWLALQTGYTALVHMLLQALDQVTGPKILVLEGFVGLPWHDFIHHFQTALESNPGKISWLSTATCFRPSDEIQTLLASSLTDDPVFGCLFHGDFQQFWQPEVLASLRVQLQEKAREGLVVLYGFGASQVTSQGLHVYIDVPKDRCQQLAAKQAICNLGADKPEAFGAMYKRFYFVDWPVLNRMKRAELTRLDFFVDGSDSTEPKMIGGDDFRRALHELAHHPFRVKPWFAPGPWGGQWMKEHFGLSAEQPNYAWSFELIAPENGILLGNAEQSLECSFDYLLWAETDAVLGVSVAARYGSYFPIRFDYLDTMGGGNLSCQVHPRVDYIREQFGEPFTQDETYYIVANTLDAQVFLGLQEQVNIDEFQDSARKARDEGTPFEIAQYVQSWPSQPHNLFLIPSGTIHCSGKNNLVLEISATPYIYTFKIYDYLRTDLQGKLRHVHLEHAFANLDPARRTTWVNDHLRPQPDLLRAGTDWAEYRLGDTPHLFFAIHRLEFVHTVEDQTQGKFVALNLVEGECCWIETANNDPVELHFAESVIIPASIDTYCLRNGKEKGRCRVVKAFVKG